MAINPSDLVAHFSFAEGTLAYIEGAEADSQSRLVLRDRQGQEIGTVGSPGNYYSPLLSPDGKRVAVDNSGNANNGDIWIHDLDRPVGTRVSRHPADESSPVWSPDGTQIAFWGASSGNGDVFLHQVGASEDPVYLYGDGEINESPSDWSSDGRTLAVTHGRGGIGDIWLYDLASGDSRPLQPGATRQDQPAFSPDGKYLAYTSEETGRDEVFLRSLEPDGRAWQISLEGGNGPRWRGDGRELFFHGADGFIHAVEITLGDGAESVILGRPQSLFRARLRFDNGEDYDVTSDGQTFLINSWVEEEAPRAMSVVLGWRP